MKIRCEGRQLRQAVQKPDQLGGGISGYGKGSSGQPRTWSFSTPFAGISVSVGNFLMALWHPVYADTRKGIPWAPDINLFMEKECSST